ncbi:MAG TPA: GNAT family N-acetyltransferase [Amycolatopsis sp.]|nr:GNAT family N-acetyltransferase [Amycolatopsis sp.]
MSDFLVRPVTEDERRGMFDLLLQSLHEPLPSDEEWAGFGGFWAAEGKFGAFDGDQAIGIASGFATTLGVPGGATVSAAAVDGVAVRADRTRRGVLTALMTAQLTDLAGRGTTIACLHASEAVIYGRFGYGPATLAKTVEVTRPAPLREGAMADGTVRLLDFTEARQLISPLYQRIGLHRPGMIARPERWWPVAHDRRVTRAGGFRVAVHTGPDGDDDGYAVFRSGEQSGKVQLEVRDFHAASPEAITAVWRFLLSIDLVTTVSARCRPVDEPVAAVLADFRRARTTEIQDDLWVRLVDVPAALAARTYGPADPVVVEVADRMLPDNGGRYVVGPHGATRTDARADLHLDVDTLAMLYLGEWRATTLALAGRITAADPAALARADTLFTTTLRPWCGTFF